MKQLQIFIIGICILLASTVNAQHLQGDTLHIESLKHERVVSPKKAAMLSAVLPGLGQIYNRKYWKLPILYGGIGLMVYGLSWNNKTYIEYRNAYVDWSYEMDGVPNNQRYLDILSIDTQASLLNGDIDEDWFLEQLENKKDSYRRDRDLLIFGSIALYVLNILDASVDAHLSDFDISEELSMKIEPSILDVHHGNLNRAIGVSCKLTF